MTGGTRQGDQVSVLVVTPLPDDRDSTAELELLVKVAELQNQIAAILGTQRILEGVCVLNGVLAAVCLSLLWLRTRRRRGIC